ncbi:SirA family protein [Escherichia coli]|nr:SirA family protein [Escherichia coli]
MKNIVPDYRLDMVGEPCPYPAVATLEAMPQLKKGEILEVVSDCPQSINNIPLDARNHGYTVLDIQQRRADHSLFNSEVIPHSRCGPQREYRCSLSHRFNPPPLLFFSV